MIELLMSNNEPVIQYPGPKELLHGNRSRGFYGETTVAELITGDALSTYIGLTAGSGFNSNEPWLKFIFQGKTIYIAKKPIRYNLNWNQIETASPGIGKEITIGEFKGIVRSIDGGAASPGTGSEWNELLYRVSVEDPTSSNWAAYSNADLGIVASTNGSLTQTLRTATGNVNNNVVRGGGSITGFNTNIKTTTGVTRGYRPVIVFG